MTSRTTSLTDDDGASKMFQAHYNIIRCKEFCGTKLLFFFLLEINRNGAKNVQGKLTQLSNG
jgi:hypothetical protein